MDNISVLLTQDQIIRILETLEEQYDMDRATLATGREAMGITRSEWNKCAIDHTRLGQLIDHLKTQVQVHEMHTRLTS